MRKFILIIVIIFVICPQIIFSQNNPRTQLTQRNNYKISGIVFDEASNDLLPGVSVMAKSLDVSDKNNYGAVTDFNGKYNLELKSGTYIFKLHLLGYQDINDTIEVRANTSDLDFAMTDKAEILNEIVVSAGKYEQKISEVTVSMEVLKPTQLENKNTFLLTQALTKLPSVDVNNDQISIRSSNGWSYGAGSRVIVLMDELPIMAPDAGVPKWDFVPMENVAQVEIIKGASSALYGSSALAGVVNMRSAFPSDKPETNVSYFVGIYGKPKVESYRWWGHEFYTEEGRNPVEILGRKSLFYYVQPPMYSGLTFNHRQKFGNFDVVLGGNHFTDEGYRESDFRKNTRFNLNMRYRAKHIEGLAVGVNSNFQAWNGSDFFAWKSDTTPFQKNPMWNEIVMSTYRVNIDPYAYYYDKNGGRYSLRTRYFLSNSLNADTTKSTKGENYYAEFQYTKTFEKRYTLTAGFVESFSDVKANLFGNHQANNISLYAQLDAKFLENRLNVGIGLRGEYFRLDKEESETLLDNFPVKPVGRIGANYALTEKTFLRTSFGQGYRFPTISEKYTETSLGQISIYPNPALIPELGWNVEMGARHSFILNKKWKGYVDLSIYYQEIYNMMEFGFALIDTTTKKPIPFNMDSIMAHPDFYWGFISTNIGDASIVGVDLSGGIIGKINKATLAASLSYTYNLPKRKDGYDISASTESTILKYRFKHAIKADVELEVKRLIAGFSLEWKSKITNVDRIFCDQRDSITVNSSELETGMYQITNLLSQLIIPGYWEYRLENANRQYFNLDVNIGLKFSNNIRTNFIVRNVFNRVYVGRPADMLPPRRFEISVSMKF